MKLLFIGDVVGKHGCEFLQQKLYSLKQKYSVDIIVANGENSAVGNGITKASAEMLFNCGVDVITTGNHAFKRRDAVQIFESDTILRPANYPDGVIGKGVCVLDYGKYSVAIVNLMGTVYMDALDNPFSTMDKILKELKTPNIFVDFHAEATAEKKAMGHYLAGKVTAVMGTHTHVQTNDEIILNNHTGYITDVGMTGPELSVLGVAIDPAVNKLKYKYPVQFSEANTSCFLNSVLVEFSEQIGRCTKINKIIER
ncbi:MAG: TIGR00282 family metallophosphoesterase [Clostridiales bacterium]|jgi:metallophosphoesterase (TIGR00282 family)|nr:TIGR00282 family metallophosphoesterase [Clostridiales bacterium]